MLPPLLQHEIQLAHKSLQKHPLGHVTEGHRRAIYTTMNDDLSLGPGLDKRGHHRRFHLAVLAVGKIYSLWEQVAPHNPAPLTMIQIAWQILNNKVVPKLVVRFSVAAAQYEDHWPHKSYGFGMEGKAALVLFMASLTTTVACCDEDFVPKVRDYTYNEPDAYGIDMAGWAADGYSGGSLVDPEMNSTHRKEFWEWWLDEAIPIAYSLSVVPRFF